MTTPAVTYVAVLTPPGRSALASISVSGPQATTIVGSLFLRPTPESPLGKYLFGRWQSAAAGEEVVVCRREADRIEIHCHGGQAAARAIVASLVEQGCREIDWREAIRGEERDPIAAEARIALASATTERTAGILWHQYRGALRQEIDAIGEALRDFDVNLDSPAPRPSPGGRGGGAMARLDRLLKLAPLGLHLVDPWQIVLAGRPNVGKSSLVNALVGFERAIVHATAGTTRDVVTTAAAFDGWPVQLVDTAGLHDSVDPLEAAGMALAREQLAAADLVLIVGDAGVGWTRDDEALAQAWPRVIRVLNKSDLAADVSDPQCLRTSAATRDGLPALEQAIAGQLVSDLPSAGQAIPFTAEQVASLESIRAALNAGDLSAARQCLLAAPWHSLRAI